MRILVISDTHIPTRGHTLPDPLMHALESGPDLVLHAGDVVSPSTWEWLQSYKPIQAVAGNMDRELAGELPYQEMLCIDGTRFALVHGDGLEGLAGGDSLRALFPDADVIIHGHTHVPRLNVRDGVWLFNPGSPTDPRAGSQPCFGWIETDPLSFQLCPIKEDVV